MSKFLEDDGKVSIDQVYQLIRFGFLGYDELMQMPRYLLKYFYEKVASESKKDDLV